MKVIRNHTRSSQWENSKLRVHKRSNMLRYIWWCFAILLCCRAIDGKILVQQLNGTQFELPAVEIIFLQSSNQKITDPVVLTPTLNQDDVAGKMYLFMDGFSNDVIISTVQSKGALAAIEVSTPWSAGFLRFRWTNRDAVRSIRIPIFEITKKESGILWPLLEQNLVANITLIPCDDPNPWDVILTSPGYYVYTAFLMAFSAANIGLAIWKIKLFVGFYGGFKVSFAMAVLFLEMISNLIRLFAVIDLFGANDIYDQTASWVLYHCSFPFTLSAIMLFSLYWHEIMTSSSIIVHPFIVKMRIPFFVISGLLLLNQVALILVGTLSVGDFSMVGTYVYLIVAVILVVFYLVTGIKILRRLQSSRKKGRKINNLRQTTVRTLISIGFLFSLIFIGCFFVAPFAYDATPYVLLWYALYLAIDGATLMNIIAFGVPANANSTTRSSGEKGRSKTNPGTSSGSTGSAKAATTESGKTESV